MNRVDRLLEPGYLLNGPLVNDLLHEGLRLGELRSGQLLGPFRIIRELGRGGMGVVYLASRADGAYEQDVAIKWLPVGEMGTHVATQFRNERQILAGLRHPHIARLLDGGVSDDGHLWFAMEHANGLRIDKHVVAHGLSWRQRVRLLLPVIDAVQFAHARQLIHRDIKPDNVVIDAEGKAILLDFGIAALMADNEARPGFTEGFASPRQLAGAPPDTTDDIWQLGQLLRIVLQAGRPDEKPVPLPADLEAVLSCAMHRLPWRRYSTAAALHDDLECLLHHQPVRARPPGTLHRLHLLARAHPWGTWATVIATVAFVALSGFLVLRLMHQRDLAWEARRTAEAVNRFLRDDVLAGADPLQGGSADVSVTVLIERALQRVQPRFGEMPEVAAQIQLTLGKSLANLGHQRTAIRAYDQAIANLVLVEGEQGARVLAARLEREQDVVAADNLRQSESRLQALRKDVLASPQGSPALLAKVDSALAEAAFVDGNFQLCVRRYQALMPALDAVDDVSRAYAHMVLSLCQARLGHGHEALEHARRSRELVLAALGPDHPYTLETGLALETAMVSLGHYHEASELLQQLVDSLGKRYGRKHPATLTAMHDLGLSLTCDGKPSAGATWLGKATHQRADVFGPNHPWAVFSRVIYAMALLQDGRMDAAASQLQRARSSLDELPDASPYVRGALHEVDADLALARGQPHKALAGYDAALGLARTLYPQGHSRLAILDLGRGLALSDMGRTKAGAEALQDALHSLGRRAWCRRGQLQRAHALLHARSQAR